MEFHSKNLDEAFKQETSISKTEKATKSSQHSEKHNYRKVVPNNELSYSCHHGETDYMQIREPDDLDSLRRWAIAEQFEWFRSNLDPFYSSLFQYSSNVELVSIYQSIFRQLCIKKLYRLFT